MKPLLIRNVSIISEPSFNIHNKDDSNKNSDILMKDGKIAQIGWSLKKPAESDILDGGGLIATPGWIDIQLNGAFGFDFTANPDSIWQAAAELLKFGTTSILPTIITSPLETIGRALENLKKGPPEGFTGANALGLHLEGPFLNPIKKGAHNPKYLLRPSPDLVQEWTRSNGVLLVTLAPELDKDFQTIRRLREQGVVVSIGHSLASYEQARLAFQHGIQCGTHLFNAQSGIEHRNPGLSIAILTTQDVFTGIIIDGVHTHRAMVDLAWTCKGSRRLITVTDAVSALGLPPGKYNLGELEINVTETAVTLNDGTLAGSKVTQQNSLRNLMAWTGCSLHDALRTVTTTPAELLNLPNKGRITPGADADVVLVDPELDIKATIVNGEILYRNI
jgi:N-acetylglucosamine-6-phosphate deacetylase